LFILNIILVLGTYKSQNSAISDSYKSTTEYQTSFSRVGDEFVKNLRVGIQTFRKTFTGSEEMRIYSLLKAPGKPLHQLSDSELSENCWLYIQPLPNLKDREVIVQVKKYERESPEIKSLDWIRAKTELEQNLPSECEECLLAGGESQMELYEGLSSNFYVIQDGVLRIAPEGTILLGTIMTLVLEACEKLHIPIIREVPTLEQIETWNGCFISSTSRLVLPVNKITFPDHPVIADREYKEQCQQIVAIKDFVQAQLEEHSTEILPKQ